MAFPSVPSPRIRLILVSLIALIGGCHAKSDAAQTGAKADSVRVAPPSPVKAPAPAPASTGAVPAKPFSKKAPGTKPGSSASKPIAASRSTTPAPVPSQAKPSPAPSAAKPVLPEPEASKPTSAQPAAKTLPSPAPKGDTLPPPLRELGQKALKVPEKLLFDIIWGGWSFKWVTAGQATLELHPTENPTVWQIRSLAWANGFFQSIYPVQDTVISLIDSRGIYPVRFEKHLNEGSYHADISAGYDQVAHTLRTEDTTLAIEPFTHDVLSAFYFIRTQKLVVGDTLDLAAVSGKKKYSLKVLCHGRETITVPAGEFHTLVVEPVLKGDGLFKAKGKLTIWVTDDAFHIPVKMVSKIPVGSIKAELVSKS